MSAKQRAHGELTAKQSWQIASMALALANDSKLSRGDAEDCLEDFFRRCEATRKHMFPETD